MPVEMDRIYKNIPLEEIFWNIQTLPDVLVELAGSGKVNPAKLAYLPSAWIRERLIYNKDQVKIWESEA